mgnify:CR=1 FL=1
MKLGQLIKDIADAEVCGDISAEISSLGFDSRAVVPGQLFFAIKGTASDGHRYIADAIAKGAAAVVCEEFPAENDKKVPYILVTESSSALGEIASRFYGEPSGKLRLVGVTGTNGKTTVATLLYDLFRGLGYKCGLISTVSYVIDGRAVEASHTTPDAVRLNAMLADMVQAGCEFCFMEVSSHSVVQGRIAGLTFTGGIFTNITHEHLDYHGTFAEYIKAKKAFFDSLPREAFALVNGDDRNGTVMIQNTVAQTRTFGMRGFDDYKVRILENTPEGMLLDVDREEVWVKFLGKFNAYNLLAVYAAARLLGADKQETLTAVSSLTPVRGRFETVRSANGVTAIIDYAHTPDALKNVLDTVNGMRRGTGRLFVVVGCGGDRDRSKRPEMARIAAEFSDMAIFTSDNPRSEDPEAILSEMKAGVEGVGKYLSITDRREAIKTAAALAAPGDIILIAGKGHETYQVIKGETHHLDDREEILKYFNK